MLGGVSCSAPARVDRPADPQELQRLRAWLRVDVDVSWSGRGWAHIDTPEGEIEGDVQLNMDAPHRARLILESDGFFGMASERVAVVLPGDGWVLTHHQRSDQLEREPFRQSRLQRWLPLGRPQDLFALTSGLPPWPVEVASDSFPLAPRIIASQDGGRSLTYRLGPEDGTEAWLVRLERDRLRAFEWWVGGERRLRIEYDDWRMQDGLERPATLRLLAPQSSVKAEVTMDSWRRVEAWSAADFEVY